MKLDVRDFDTTGTPSELKDSIKVLFPPGPRCRLLCEAVEYLLSSEYVVSNLVPGRVFRVVRGSGMGHRHSGCIADCSFFALGERICCKITGCSRVSELSDTVATEMMF